MFDLLLRLSPADRLELLAFDAELRRLPRPLIEAIWAGVDAVKHQRTDREHNAATLYLGVHRPAAAKPWP
jgi:hypothetical protein